MRLQTEPRLQQEEVVVNQEQAETLVGTCLLPCNNYSY